MSTSIDERVVEMKFDNRQFESNVKTSMSTIDKLKEKLNFNGAAKGLDGINDSAKRINFSAMASAIDTITKRFSTLGVMGTTALVNITNSAVNSAKRIASEFTVAPVKTGLSEYETKLNSVQTILANTQKEGTNLKTVTAALDELNLYADKTIYNFSEMTRNIGTFTAAGVSLETSVDAIKGISNLAAVSGSSSQQASTAMYQLSQALSSGTVKLMDWNSVVNAGMGGQVFQDALKETARVRGINIDAIIEKSGSFRETLQEGWLSSEILTETLSKFTGDLTAEQMKAMGYNEEQIKGIQKLGKTANDAATKVKTFTQLMDTLKESTQSGWATTWEILVGDFEEAKVLWTDVSNVFGEFIQNAANSRNELLKGWVALGGRQDIIDSFKNSFKALLKVITPIKEAFDEIFPPMTAQRLSIITKGIKEFTSKLIMSDTSAENLKRTFKGLFAIIDIITTLTGGVFKVVLKTIMKLISKTDDGVLGVTASIGDILVKIRDWIKENNFLVKGLEKVIGWIFAGVGAVNDWISEFMNLPFVQENLSKLGTNIGDAVSKLKEHFGEGIQKAKDFIKSIKNMDSISFADIGNIFKRFKEDVLGHFLDIDGCFDGTVTTLQTFRDKIEEHFGFTGEKFDGLKEKIKGFYEFIKEKIGGKIGIGEILTVALGVGLISSMRKLGGTFDMLTEPIGGVTKALKGFTLNMKADAILKIAKAIAILVGSIAALTLLDQKKMGAAVVVILSLGAALLAISAALSKLPKDTGTIKTSLSIISLAASVLILTKALKDLDSLNRDNIISNLAILGVLIGGMALVATKMSIAAPQLSQGSLFFLSFASSIKILVSAIDDINNLDTSNLGKTFVILLSTIASMSLLAKSTKSVNGKAALSIIAMVVAFKMLIGTFDDIAELDLSAIRKALPTIVTIFGMFSVLMVSSNLAGKNALKAGVAIIAMSVAFRLIVGSIKQIAKMDGASVDKATNSISKILLLFGVLTAASNLAGNNAMKAGAMLLAMSAAMILLTGVIVVLSKIDPDGLKRAVMAIAVIEILFAGLIAATKLTDAVSKDSIKSLIVLATTIGILAASIGALSTIDPERLKASSLALSSVMAMFALLTASTKLAKDANSSLLMMLAVVAGVGMILTVITNEMKNTESALVIAGSISLLLTSLSASMIILSNVKSISPSTLLALGAMTLVVAGLATIIGVLASLNVGPALDIAASLSLLLISLSASMIALGVAGKMGSGAFAGVAGKTGSGAFVGVGALITLLASIGLLAAGVGALMEELPVLEKFVDKGLIVLEKIALGVGSIFGNIIGGFTAGLTSGLPKIGKNLTDFADESKAFFEAMGSSTTKDSLDGIKTIAEAMLILGATNVVNGIAAFLPGSKSLTDIGKELVSFGPYFAKYAKSMDGLSVETIQNSATAAKAVAEFASSIPNSGGLLAKIVGDNSIAEFAKELVIFGPRFKMYANSITGIDAEAVENSARAAGALSEMASGLPNSGGKLAEWIGDNKLGDFAQELVIFGPRLKLYADSVSGLDTEVVEKSATAAKALAELANCLPNSGGKLADWIGDNKLGDFAQELVIFGPRLKLYADSVSGLDTVVVEKSAIAAKTLAELADSLPNSGGLLSKVFGDNNIGDFGNDLITFGTKFREYSNEMSYVKTNIIDTTTLAAESLVTLQNSLGKYGLFSSKQTLSDFGADMSSFGYEFKQYYAYISEINTAILYGATTQLAKLIAVFKGAAELDIDKVNSFGNTLAKLGEQGVDEFIAKFTNAKQEVIDAGRTLLTNFIDGVNFKSEDVKLALFRVVDDSVKKIRSKYIDFYSAGQTIMIKLSTGINSKRGSIISNFEGLINDSVETIRDMRYKFYSAGSYMVDGFVKGIDDNIKDAESKARRMAELTKKAAEKTLEIHSPSKVFYKIGDYTGQGFVKGLGDSESDVTDGTTEMTFAAVSAMKKVIEKLLETINDNSDEFETGGITLMRNLITGMKSPEVPVEETMNIVLNNVLNSVRTKYSEFENAGKELMRKFIDGIRSLNSEMESAAKECMDELANGFSSKTEDVRDAVDTVILSALDRLLGFQDAFEAIGKLLADALIDSITEAERRAEQSLQNIQSKAKQIEQTPKLQDSYANPGRTSSIATVNMNTLNGSTLKLTNIASGKTTTTPTITPVATTKSPTVSVSSGSLTGAKLTNSTTQVRLAQINADLVKSYNEGAKTPTTTTNTYNFNQNNYSPKALSTTDIYRQTSGQFSKFERMTLQ